MMFYAALCSVGLLLSVSCSGAGLPASVPMQTLTAPVATPSGVSCQACMRGVGIAEALVGGVQSRGDVDALITGQLCAGADDVARCERRAAVAGHLLMQALTSGTPPATQCAALCTGSAAAEALATSPDLDWAALAAPADQRASTGAAAARARKGGDLECPFCEFVVAALRESLSDGATQEEVLAEARAACNELPASFAVPCVDYVDEKGPLLIALLEGSEPQGICTLAGACGSVLADVRAEPLPLEVASVMARLGSLAHTAACSPSPQALLGAPMPAHLQNAQACEFCKIAVMEARLEIQNPQFQAAAEAYAKKLCKQLNPDFQPECIESVSQYGPLLFSLAEGYLQPTTVCTGLLHLCPLPPPSMVV